jgi:glycosyl transferase family 10 (putative fucosyltransferase)
MATVFFADPMDHTPFEARQRDLYLPAVGLSVAALAEEADVIVGRRLSSVSPLFRLKKRYYIWTHEPRWAPIGERYIRDQAWDTTVAVSSAFNGDVYVSPLHYIDFVPLQLDDVMRKARQKTERCAFLGTYRADASVYVGGVNRDLTAFRQSLALYLQGAGLCKIYGRGWPEHFKTEGESRGPGWHIVKREILSRFQYNLAVENTLAHNYVTEKHWDPTQTACVQIYFASGSGVEAVSPVNTFIDCSRGATFDDIAGRLEALGKSDREGMVEAAVGAYNATCESTSKQVVTQSMVARFAERVGELMDGG